MSTLAVLLDGDQVATLEQTGGGQHELTYDNRAIARTPLSLSMPLGAGPFRHRIVDPYLEGLLPERESTRESMGRSFGVSSRNPFALLRHMGLDCAGAVQFCAADEVASVRDRDGELIALTDSEIGARLRALRTDGRVSWLAPRERWSLAGAQAKMALRLQDGVWHEATGAQPTSHILKPGVEGFRLQALNEHLCLETARRLGLPAARTAWREFDGERALVVERYDRRVGPDGRMVRVHQEDLCQATSTYPRRKYESDGGPRASSVIELLRTRSTRRYRADNITAFLDALAFNVLIQAPDAHAKNYSVLLHGDAVRLAPLRRRLGSPVRRTGAAWSARFCHGCRRTARVRQDHFRAVACARGRSPARRRRRHLAGGSPRKATPGCPGGCVRSGCRRPHS